MFVLFQIGCREPEAGRPQNLILISIDTLRADRLGCYGYSRETSPSLDGLAERGVRFSDVTAASPWTLPSHITILTGLYPSRHGVRSERQRLGEEVPTLATVLRDAGLRTKAIVNCYYLSPRYGLDAGYDEYEVVSEWEVAEGGGGRRAHRAEEITDRAIEWLDSEDERSFFLFLHYYDVHSDYSPEPRYRDALVRPYDGKLTGTTEDLVRSSSSTATLSGEDLRFLNDLYDAEIRQLDENLKRLFEWLRSSGLETSTLVVVTSDHGEEFLEHGSFLHGRTHFREVIQVPWIIAGPSVPQGQEVEESVGSVDLMPTVLALLGCGSPDCDGRDLRSLFSESAVAPETRDRFYFAEADHNNELHDMKRMVRFGKIKLLYDRSSKASAMFRVDVDPGETTDIGNRESGMRTVLLRKLEEFMKLERQAEQIPEPSPQERQRLLELGYLKDKSGDE